MDKRQTPNRESDPELQALYVELDAVEIALEYSMFRVTSAALRKRRGELLGKIKKLEREYNEQQNSSD
jgi:hypothetical protein